MQSGSRPLSLLHKLQTTRHKTTTVEIESSPQIVKRLNPRRDALSPAPVVALCLAICSRQGWCILVQAAAFDRAGANKSYNSPAEFQRMHANVCAWYSKLAGRRFVPVWAMPEGKFLLLYAYKDTSSLKILSPLIVREGMSQGIRLMLGRGNPADKTPHVDRQQFDPFNHTTCASSAIQFTWIFGSTPTSGTSILRNSCKCKSLLFCSGSVIGSLRDRFSRVVFFSCLIDLER